MIKLSNAVPADAELLAKLGRQAFFEAFGVYNDPQDMQAYLDKSFDPDFIRIQLTDDTVSYVIAYFDEVAAGYSKIKRNNAPPELQGNNCMQLERIYALQAFLGKKVGSSLMKNCIDAANKESYDHLWLGVWQQNDRAIAFYKQWGFTIIGTKQFIIGKEVNDDFVMSLALK